VCCSREYHSLCILRTTVVKAIYKDQTSMVEERNNHGNVFYLPMAKDKSWVGMKA
jgi:hypothetical protein